MNSAAALAAIQSQLDELRQEIALMREGATPAAAATRSAALPERMLLQEAAGHVGMHSDTLRKHLVKSKGRLGRIIDHRWVVFRDPLLASLAERGRLPKRLR